MAFKNTVSRLLLSIAAFSTMLVSLPAAAAEDSLIRVWAAPITSPQQLTIWWIKSM